MTLRASGAMVRCRSLTTNCDTFFHPWSRCIRRQARYSLAPLLSFSREGSRGRLHAVQAEAGKAGLRETTADQNVYYTVKEGDTLTLIARKYKTSVQSIVVVNNIPNADYIPAGKLLIVFTQSRNASEAISDPCEVEILSPNASPVRIEPAKVYKQAEGSYSMPLLASLSPCQLYLVKAAAFLLATITVISLVKKYFSDLETKIHLEVLRRQAEKEIHDADHRPRLRRWQGILNEDRELEETENLEGQMHGPSSQETEEERLRQSYAQLESAYARFLADSGLSKSGYWRGGVPPASESD